MNYNEALNLFGFTGSFTEESLRKKYLELSKKYHPDMGGSDEMMKKVNAAYVALKGKSTNYDLTYFNSLKEKLQKFVSKKVYESGSAEYECVNKINELVNSFAYISNKVILNSAYNNILAKINSVLSEYRKTVLNNIPEKFLKKYDNNIADCIDEFIKKVNVIKKDYENIENTLNNVVQSLDITINASTLEKIIGIKETILNDIIDNNVSLEDGTNKFRCEIMTMIMQKEALDKELEETYNAILVNFNARMKELKFTDNEQIQTSLDILREALAKLQLVKENKLNKETLSSLKTIDFKVNVDFENVEDKNDNQENDNYEIFITRDSNKDIPEFVIKLFKDGEFIHFLRKFINDSQKNEVDEFLTSESNFYEKYMRLDEFLDNAEFINKFYNDYYGNGRLALYLFDNTVIYITNNGAGTIKASRIGDLGLVDESSYYPYMYGLQYKKRIFLKNGILDDFKKYLIPKSKYKLDYNIQKDKFNVYNKDKFNVYNGKGR